MAHLDQPLLPASGALEVSWPPPAALLRVSDTVPGLLWFETCPLVLLQVLPLYVKTASLFYGRIIRKEDERAFQSMVADLAAGSAEKRPAALRVEEGGLYLLQEDTHFHRWD